MLNPMSCAIWLSLILWQTSTCDLLSENRIFGDSCYSISNAPGRCVQLYQCPKAMELVKNSGYPALCRFEGRNPIVCCENATPQYNAPNSRPIPDPFRPSIPSNRPKITQTLPYRPSTMTGRPPTTSYVAKQFSTTTKAPITYQDKPMEKHEIQCRLYSFRKVYAVVSGVKARPRVFIHMAILGYGNEKDRKWYCGGSLISEDYVLTAAHCLDTDFGKVKVVRLGEYSLSKTDDDAFPKDFSVVQAIPHPQYDYPSTYHDIALLKLNESVYFGLYMLPACLYKFKNESDFPALVATGWGQTGFTDDAADELMKVNLKVASYETCKNSYRLTAKRLLARGIDPNTQICAGGAGDKKDTCLGDSGGPLSYDFEKYYRDDYGNRPTSMHYLIGITSFGKACSGSVAGVYTRISYYIPWIENIVWPGVISNNG